MLYTEIPRLILPEENHQTLRVASGHWVVLRCVATGIPPPNVKMYHSGLLITSEVPFRTQVRKSLVVNQATAGEYVCLASNTIVSRHGGQQPHFAQKTISVEVIGEWGGSAEGGLEWAGWQLFNGWLTSKNSLILLATNWQTSTDSLILSGCMDNQ